MSRLAQQQLDDNPQQHEEDRIDDADPDQMLDARDRSFAGTAPRILYIDADDDLAALPDRVDPHGQFRDGWIRTARGA